MTCPLHDHPHFIHFSKGLIGFEECRQFQMSGVDEEERLFGLVNMEVGYQFLIKEIDVDKLKSYLPKHYELSHAILWRGFCVVTLHEEKPGVITGTMNTRAPILINFKDFDAEQIVLNNEKLSFAEPFSLHAITRNFDDV